MQIPGFEGYGGATITRAYDATGAEYVGLCGKRLRDGLFGFYIFRNGVEVPYTPFCTGRGSISPGGHWVAWQGKEFHKGPIPGFVPHATRGEKGDRGETGPQGPAGEGASLSASDRAALEWVKKVRELG